MIGYEELSMINSSIRFYLARKHTLAALDLTKITLARRSSYYAELTGARDSLPAVSDAVQKVIAELGEFNYLKWSVPAVTIEQRNPMVVNNGNIYKGHWNTKNNERDGTGALWFVDGSLYEGSFSAGKRSGYGRFIRYDGECYVGEWYEDAMHD